ncbi:hypothetical protein BU23DRAFT_445293, partial [Bimuria novae-zelandiae CBS 107.79]
IRQFTQEDLVFLNKSIFNKKTSWRHKAYRPISSTITYLVQELKRVTITTKSLLTRSPIVIILDNVLIYTNNKVTEILKAASHVVRFLPPYLPNYNPIELTFSVLKY